MRKLSIWGEEEEERTQRGKTPGGFFLGNGERAYYVLLSLSFLSGGLRRKGQRATVFFFPFSFFGRGAFLWGSVSSVTREGRGGWFRL